LAFARAFSNIYCNNEKNANKFGKFFARFAKKRKFAEIYAKPDSAPFYGQYKLVPQQNSTVNILYAGYFKGTCK
jgi:hypothetical protein